MRNRVAEAGICLLAMLVFSPAAAAQAPGGRGGRGAQQASDAQPAGPAPKHDLNGVWQGPVNRAGANPVPPYTALGQKMFRLNKPEPVFLLGGSNDPVVTCDPLGFPRSVLGRPSVNPALLPMGMQLAALPDRMLLLYQYQRVWREIWMDGRQLPRNVDAKGGPESKFYGYSVGHWDGDYTFVINTVGLDKRTWLDGDGHPHSVDMQVEERYTRADQNTIELTLTVKDPKVYTMPFEWITKATYKWKPQQELDETFCVPSEALAYRDTLAAPTGQ
jgi:hypothetical protein